MLPTRLYVFLHDHPIQFCTLNHGVTFPLMKKSDVNGDDTNEVGFHREEGGLG